MRESVQRNIVIILACVSLKVGRYFYIVLGFDAFWKAFEHGVWVNKWTAGRGTSLGNLGFSAFIRVIFSVGSCEE